MDSKKKKDDQSELSRQVEEIVKMCLASPNCLLQLDEASGGDAKGGANDKLTGKEVIELQAKQAVLSSEPLHRSLRLVERLLQQSVYHERHLNYRSLPPILSFSAAAEAASAEKKGNGALLEQRKQYVVVDGGR